VLGSGLLRDVHGLGDLSDRARAGAE
jgi:hypothetical protein